MSDNAARTMRQRRVGIVRAMLLLVRGYNAAKNLCLSAPIWPVKHDKDMEPCEDMNDKSKPALSLVPPQARHHFTRFDQVDQLVGANEADPDLGFMGRVLALCSLPRTNPGNRDRYVRKNGPFTLVMIAGGEVPKLPYGSIPRLLLAWVCTEAVRTQSRKLVLGKSLAQFMRKLGIATDSGGSRGERTRVRHQMDRLFTTTLQFVYEDQTSDGTMVKDTFTSSITRKTHLAWNPRRTDEPVLWESTIELGHDFFQEIIRKPVPLDMNILRGLKRSPLGLDLYLWLIYRTFSLTRPMLLSWSHLYNQFGVDPKRARDRVTVDSFRKDCLRELVKIRTAWPGLKYRIERGIRGKKTGALVLLPSTPSIPPKHQIVK